MSLSKFRRDWLSNVRGDLLAGLVVALALIPEAIAFSIIAGVDPKVGLYASFSIAVIIAFTGGRPGMISAATGAMALVMVTLVKDHGLQYLLAATVLTGVLQIVAGAAAPGRADALRLALGDHRLRQRAGDPDLHGAAARADERELGRLCDDGGRPGHHLRLALPHQGGAVAAGHHRRADRRWPCCWTWTSAPWATWAQLPDSLPMFLLPDVPLNLETLQIIAAVLGHAGGRRPARVDDDGVDRRRTDRHPQQQEPRVRRPGHGQHRHRLHRRHGRLRDDRPVGHQREVGRPRPPVDAGGGPVPADPGGLPRAAGSAGSRWRRWWR